MKIVRMRPTNETRVELFKELVKMHRQLRAERTPRLGELKVLEYGREAVSPLELHLLLREIGDDLLESVSQGDARWVEESYQTLLSVLAEYRETLEQLGTSVPVAMVPVQREVPALDLGAEDPVEQAAAAEMLKLMAGQPFDIEVLCRGRVPDFDELPECGIEGCRACEARKDWFKNQRVH